MPGIPGPYRPRRACRAPGTDRAGPNRPAQPPAPNACRRLDVLLSRMVEAPVSSTKPAVSPDDSPWALRREMSSCNAAGRPLLGCLPRGRDQRVGSIQTVQNGGARVQWLLRAPQRSSAPSASWPSKNLWRSSASGQVACAIRIVHQWDRIPSVAARTCPNNRAGSLSAKSMRGTVENLSPPVSRLLSKQRTTDH